MVTQIFARLGECFRPEAVPHRTTYYFSIGQLKRTVMLTPDGCEVQEGRTTDSADCVCKMQPELFLRVWHEGYQPGMKDFLSGSIKSNDPQMLKGFLQAFGKG